MYVVLFVLHMRSNSCCTAALDGSVFRAAFAVGNVLLLAAAAADPSNSNTAAEIASGVNIRIWSRCYVFS